MERICNTALPLFHRNDQAQVLVTTGTGKFYSNGMDLQWFTPLSKAGKEQKIWDILKDVTSLIARILTFPMPTIAAINGKRFKYYPLYPH